ncbi:hypothetical protein ACV07N_12920 [Roseivirga echinicomitans]
MKKTLTLIILFVSVLSLTAQKSIEELVNMPDKKFERLVNTNNSAVLVKSFANNARRQANLDLPDPLIPEIKRVGILSFFTADFSEVDAKAMRRVMKNGGSARLENWLSLDGGKAILNTFYEESESALRSAFAKEDIELLTPMEYLTDDSMIDTYSDYQVEISKAVSAILSAADYLNKEEEKSIVAATGYRVYPAAVQLGGTDPKVIKSMADLTQKLKVDALLTVQIVTVKEKEQIGLKAIRIALHSPNPVPDHPDIKYGLGSYMPGVLLEYAGTEFGEGIPFATMTEKVGGTFKEVNTDLFDELIARYTNILVSNLITDYAGKK